MEPESEPLQLLELAQPDGLVPALALQGLE